MGQSRIARKTRRRVRRRKLSISLPADLVDAVHEAVESRRYASASEVIRDALRDWQLAATAAILRPRRRRVPPTVSDLTPGHLMEIEVLAKSHGIARFAIRGSARKRRVEAAVALRPPFPHGWTAERTREEMERYLSFRWMRRVHLVLFEALADAAEWAVVYEAGFCGSETDSSSTS